MRIIWLAVALAALSHAAAAEQVGEVGVDWVGNDIIIEAFEDPKVKGVTCHLAYFDRSVVDRLSQGNWFEDPSYSAVDCSQTGPITLGDIDEGTGGEDVFSASRSLIFKSLKVTRIFCPSACGWRMPAGSMKKMAFTRLPGMPWITSSLTEMHRVAG